mgnify:CR=1 FL=1|tara:strand:+ start:675 stop:1991 length:1317 start_codon:yes stop_codon:yes gene_type:complete
MEKIKNIKVLVPLEADIIHPGNINIIQNAKNLGSVVIGLYTDEAISKYKRVPILNYSQRKNIVESLKGVSEVIQLDSMDFSDTVKDLKPAYVVHGDDWREGFFSNIRMKVINSLNQYGGELIEPAYTKDVSASEIISQINYMGITPEKRRKSLKKLLENKPYVRFIESHNGLTALIAEQTTVKDTDQLEKTFDGMWLSSLTVSTSKGMPDTELVDFSTRFQTIEEIMEVSTKPIIVDGDSGGEIEHFSARVRTLERLGVSAVIIEDKVGLKRNSLFGTELPQTQDTIENFSNKIIAGRNARVTKDFMIIARIESLILGAGQEDAIKRAKAYIKAGVDGVMIHSKDKSGDEIKLFCKNYNKIENKVYLVAVPSAYSHMKERELSDLGINVIIYANHLIRSAYPAMVGTAKSILKNERAKETSDKDCMSIKEIINLIPFS